MSHDNPVPSICVVGSSNIDQLARVPALPKPGETVFGTSYKVGFGGKGANQAVMAARLGASVAMVTKLGEDSNGRMTLENYKSQGVQTDFVFMDKSVASGVAAIWVDASKGENSIVVVPGANDALTPSEVQSARSAIEAAGITVAQFETPIECTITAFQLARAAGRRTLLNTAPVRDIPRELYAVTDLLVPNESEASFLAGVEVYDVATARQAAQKLMSQGARNVLITLGAKGAYALSEAGQEYTVDCPKVEVVDTTGAGDCFIGSLAYALAKGDSLEQAMRIAVQIASISVTKEGTQTSYPSRAELGWLLGDA